LKPLWAHSTLKYGNMKFVQIINCNPLFLWNTNDWTKIFWIVHLCKFLQFSFWINSKCYWVLIE
jgi:hypothetical protein